jgi:hypothetical protein
MCHAGPVAVDGFTGRAFDEHDETWDWSAAKEFTRTGLDAVKNYSESAALARRADQKAGLRKGVVYRASNWDPDQVYEARAHGMEALCGTVRALSRRAPAAAATASRTFVMERWWRCSSTGSRSRRKRVGAGSARVAPGVRGDAAVAA